MIFVSCIAHSPFIPMSNRCFRMHGQHSYMHAYCQLRCTLSLNPHVESVFQNAWTALVHGCLMSAALHAVPQSPCQIDVLECTDSTRTCLLIVSCVAHCPSIPSVKSMFQNASTALETGCRAPSITWLIVLLLYRLYQLSHCYWSGNFA